MLHFYPEYICSGIRARDRDLFTPQVRPVHGGDVRLATPGGDIFALRWILMAAGVVAQNMFVFPVHGGGGAY